MLNATEPFASSRRSVDSLRRLRSGRLVVQPDARPGGDRRFRLSEQPLRARRVR